MIEAGGAYSRKEIMQKLSGVSSHPSLAETLCAWSQCDLWTRCTRNWSQTRFAVSPIKPRTAVPRLYHLQDLQWRSRTKHLWYVEFHLSSWSFGDLANPDCVSCWCQGTCQLLISKYLEPGLKETGASKGLPLPFFKYFWLRQLFLIVQKRELCEFWSWWVIHLMYLRVAQTALGPLMLPPPQASLLDRVRCAWRHGIDSAWLAFPNHLTPRLTAF